MHHMAVLAARKDQQLFSQVHSHLKQNQASTPRRKIDKQTCFPPERYPGKLLITTVRLLPDPALLSQ